MLTTPSLSLTIDSKGIALIRKSLLIVCTTIANTIAITTAVYARDYYLPYPAGKSYAVTQSWQSPDPRQSHSTQGNYYLYNQYAVDFGMSPGEEVVAAGPGKVIRSSRDKIKTDIGGCDEKNDKYARYIVIDHGNNESSLYLHLSEESVSEGDIVTQGQVIGKSGKTGYVCGAHLHFAFQKTDTIGSRYGTVIPIGFKESENKKPIPQQYYTSQNRNQPEQVRGSFNGDFNGDGRDDLLFQHTSGQTHAWLSGPTGKTSQGLNIDTPIAPEWSFAGSGDFNGDGVSDIMWRNTNNQFHTWLLNKSGAVQSRVNVNFLINNEWTQKR
jgi:murein DD-endopeptidase MepM/ murein hydrolase activator NlpD